MTGKKTVTVKFKKQWIDVELGYRDITDTRRLATVTFLDYNERMNGSYYTKRTGWNIPFTVLKAVGDETWKYLLEVGGVNVVYFVVLEENARDTLAKVARRYLKQNGYYGMVLKDENGFEVNFDVLP